MLKVLLILNNLLKRLICDYDNNFPDDNKRSWRDFNKCSIKEMLKDGTKKKFWVFMRILSPHGNSEILLCLTLVRRRKKYFSLFLYRALNLPSFLYWVWLYTVVSDLFLKLLIFYEIKIRKIQSQNAISELLTLKFLSVMRKKASILAMIYLK